MEEIRGEAKNIRSLLANEKFHIDYYQREYRWKTEQITELLSDLCGKFLENYQENHERKEVDNYQSYFLGSIIINDTGTKRFIIDGQQRLTSLTLLLIYICHKDPKCKELISNLIYSEKYGEKSFNLNVKEREPCMKDLFENGSFDSEEPGSVTNILDRYQDIEKEFPQQNLSAEVLLHFVDWLVERVYLVEITADSDDEAYTIFETMNDRGLSLTSTEMLKGYLLSKIDSNERDAASESWNKRVAKLRKIGKSEDGNAIKAWLRSQYAKTQRERKKDAQPGDFELIGNQFHRWVRGNEGVLKLSKSSDFYCFITEGFQFYSKWYEYIRRAADEHTEGLEAIHYNKEINFTLQYPALLAPLSRNDDDKIIKRKLRLVALYLDILLTRRIWNGKSTSYNAMEYTIQSLILGIRGKSVPELTDLLTENLDSQKETFRVAKPFTLNVINRPRIHRLLARMTDYLETCSANPSRYSQYMQRGKNGYEVEHIWADKYQAHKDEFEHQNDFAEYRNHFGGLLLLPKKINASLGGKPYSHKQKQYIQENLLARSLHKDAYKNNPGFLQFIKKSGLAFKAHPEFKRADLDVRQELYRELAEQIWDPEQLKHKAEA